MEHGRLYLPPVFCTLGNFRTACHENRQSPLLYSSSFNSGRFPAYHILDSLWYIGSRCRRFLCCSAPHHEKNAADQRYERSDRRLHQTPFCPCLPLSGASCGTCLSGRTASSGEKKRKQKPAYLPKDAAFTKSFFSSSSAHFWAILQKPYSAASPPVSG